MRRRLMRGGGISAVVAGVGLAAVAAIGPGSSATAAPPEGTYTGLTGSNYEVTFSVSGSTVLNWQTYVVIGCSPFQSYVGFDSIPLNADGSFSATVDGDPDPDWDYIMTVTGQIDDGGNSSGTVHLQTNTCGSSEVTGWTATADNPPPETTEPPPVTTEPPPVTTEPPPVTTEPPPVTTEPPPVTTEPPPVTTEPPPVTTEPGTTVPTTNTTVPRPTTVPTTNSTVPPTTTAPGLRLTMSDSVVVAGRQVTVTGHGFQPGEQVTAVQHSTPLELGTQVAATDGSVSFTWSIRADETPGRHEVVLTGETSGTVSAWIEVVAGDELPETGGGNDLLIAVAVGLVCLGGALALGSRRVRES